MITLHLFGLRKLTTFPNDSRIYNEWLNKPVGGIPENYTYLVAGSDLAKQVSIGDNITTMIQFDTPKYYNTSTVYVNLTVAGFAELTENGYQLLSGNGGSIFTTPPPTPTSDGYQVRIGSTNRLQKRHNDYRLGQYIQEALEYHFR